MLSGSAKSMKCSKSSGHVCAVPGCYNNQKKRTRLKDEICREHSVQRSACGCNIYRFHRFPVDVRLRHQWLVFLDREGYVPSDCSRMCSEHFIDGDRVSYPVPIHKVAPKRRALSRKRPAATPIARVETLSRSDIGTAVDARSQLHNIVFWHMATGENVELGSINRESAGITDKELLAKANLGKVRFSDRAGRAVAPISEARSAAVGRLAEAENAGTQSVQIVRSVPPSESNTADKEPSCCPASPAEDMEPGDAIGFCEVVYKEPTIVSSYSLATPHKLFPPMPGPDETVADNAFFKHLGQLMHHESPAITKQELEPASSLHEFPVQKNSLVVKEARVLGKFHQEPRAWESPGFSKQGQDSGRLLHHSTIQKAPVITKRELDTGSLMQHTSQQSMVQHILALQSPAQQSPAQQQISAQQIPARQVLTQQILTRQSPAQQSPSQQCLAQQHLGQQNPALQSPAQQCLAQQHLGQQSLAQQHLGQQSPAQQSPPQHSLAQEGPVQESQAVAEQAPEPMGEDQEEASSSSDHTEIKALLSAPALSSRLRERAALSVCAGLSDHGYCKSAPSVLRRRVKEAAVREALAQIPWWMQCTVQST